MAKRNLRILHTSDWHLGHKLVNLNRDAEQEAALDWLLESIKAEKIDVLLVSGDVFDTSTPPIAAESMYYRFLAGLLRTQCRHVIITGGNHDSAAKLHAPKPLMEALKIHVIGQPTPDPQDQLLVFKDADGAPELVVAAVPFLREQHLNLKLTGQTIDERRACIRDAIKLHFDTLGELAASQKAPGTVHICMAHLCVGGSETTDDQSKIYLGDSHTLDPKDFHPEFDYVALGHIHRAQKFTPSGSIRYSGSLIPLSFSEINQKKVVCIVDFQDGQLLKVRELEVPTIRRLVRIRTNMDNLHAELLKHASVDPAYPSWAEVIIESELPVPLLHQTLMAATEQLSIEILKHSNVTHTTQQKHAQQLEMVNQLRVEEVFERKARQMGYTDEQITEMLRDFGELRNWYEEKSGA